MPEQRGGSITHDADLLEGHLLSHLTRYARVRGGLCEDSCHGAHANQVGGGSSNLVVGHSRGPDAMDSLGSVVGDTRSQAEHGGGVCM